jgi:hypothetical protein
LLETCDIINLANLPEQDRHIAQKQQELKLRGLYIPLRVQVEPISSKELAESGEDEKLWTSLEERRAAARRGKGKDEGSSDQRVSVGERLERAKRLVVLGDPGAGKTTLTRWIATAYLLRLKQDKDWKELPDVKTLPEADWLPIIIRCRDLGLNPLTEPIRNDFAQEAASRLKLTMEEVRARYEALADRFHLNLEWRPVSLASSVEPSRTKALTQWEFRRTGSSFPHSATVTS